MDERLWAVVGDCYGAMLRDEPWQEFGFRKCPKYGSLIQKLRRRWRVELEKKLLREMLVIFTAAHVRQGHISVDQIDEIAAMYTVDPLRAQHHLFWGTGLGYPSQEEAFAHLSSSIKEYACAPFGEGATIGSTWASMLIARVGPMSLPDEPSRIRILAGCARFAVGVELAIGIDLLRAKCGMGPERPGAAGGG